MIKRLNTKPDSVSKEDLIDKINEIIEKLNDE